MKPIFQVAQPNVATAAQHDIPKFFELLGAELRNIGGWNVKAHDDRLEFGEIAIPYGRQPAYLSNGVVLVGSNGSVGFEARISQLNLKLTYVIVAVFLVIVIWRLPLEALWVVAFALAAPWAHLFFVRGFANKWLTERIRKAAAATN